MNKIKHQGQDVVTNSKPCNPRISQLQAKSARFFMKYLTPAHMKNPAPENNRRYVKSGTYICKIWHLTTPLTTQPCMKNLAPEKVYKKVHEKEGRAINYQIGIGDYNREMYKIETNNSYLVVSPEHKVYVDVANEEFSLSNNSLVFNTSTLRCFFRNFSSDQIGQLNLNASARYSLSFICLGNNSQAAGMNDENSCSEINLTLSLKTDSKSENSASVLCVFDNIFSLLLVNSSKIKSGAISSMLLDTNISLDDLLPLISNENNSLASITTSIYLCLLENLFDKASFTFLPNLNASSCVNSLSFVNDSNILSCTIFFSNASLATSDQFIILNSDISRLSFSGSDKVKFGIFTSNIFNHINTQDTHIYKSFGVKDLSDFSLMKIFEVYKSLGNKTLILLDKNNNQENKEKNGFTELVNAFAPKHLNKYKDILSALNNSKNIYIKNMEVNKNIN